MPATGSTLFIFGASGHAREVALYVAGLQPDRPILYVDRTPSGEHCVSAEEYLARLAEDPTAESVLGSGRCDIRVRMLREMRPPFATVVHPSAVVLGTVGAGGVIAPGAVVAPYVQLGEHVLVNYNATVGHDTLVGRLSVIGPGAAVSGACVLEEEVYVGAGAAIREGVRIGRGAVIGMGAVVVSDVPPETVAIGVPATIKARPSGGGRWL